MSPYVLVETPKDIIINALTIDIIIIIRKWSIIFLWLWLCCLAMIMSPLRYLFPLDHKKLMFISMIMFNVIISLVGTKPKENNTKWYSDKALNHLSSNLPDPKSCLARIWICSEYLLKCNQGDRPENVLTLTDKELPEDKMLVWRMSWVGYKLMQKWSEFDNDRRWNEQFKGRDEVSRFIFQTNVSFDLMLSQKSVFS